MKETFFSEKKPLLILAPMAGITDLPFRLICKQFGADIVYSEMISTSGLFYYPKPSLLLAKSSPKDEPLYLQLFGNNPDHFAHATKIIQNFPLKPASQGLRRPEGIDINFGCPVKKVMKQGSGCNLMRNPALAKKIIEAVTKNTDLPVSIKIRAGIEHYTALDFLKTTASAGWKTVIIHGRTYHQGFSGEVDTALIQSIKNAYPEKIVIANGGITSPETAKELLMQTNADGIAIARGCLGKPWLFQQTKEYLSSGKYFHPTLQEIKEIVMSHAKLAFEHSPHQNLIEIRKHLGWYFRGIPDAKKIRSELTAINTLEDIAKTISLIK